MIGSYSPREIEIAESGEIQTRGWSPVHIRDGSWEEDEVAVMMPGESMPQTSSNARLRVAPSVASSGCDREEPASRVIQRIVWG